jgi:hypothetical protein
MNAGILREGNDQRDTGMAALNAKGSIDAELLPHQQKVTRQTAGQTAVTQKGVSGMANEQMVR